MKHVTRELYNICMRDMKSGVGPRPTSPRCWLPDLMFVIVAGNSSRNGLCVVMPTSIDPDHLSTRQSRRICTVDVCDEYWLTVCAADKMYRHILTFTLALCWQTGISQRSGNGFVCMHHVQTCTEMTKMKKAGNPLHLRKIVIIHYFNPEWKVALVSVKIDP